MNEKIIDQNEYGRNDNENEYYCNTKNNIDKNSVNTDTNDNNFCNGNLNYNYNCNHSISLIDDYKTSYDDTKIPIKKKSFKQIMYRKRIKYGNLCNSGVCNTQLRFLPTLELPIVISTPSITNLVKINTNDKVNAELSNLAPLDENFVNKLLNDSELHLFTRQSRREIKLKKMLEEKIRKLIFYFK